MQRIIAHKTPYAVESVEHLYITLSDGTRLATRLWLPEGACLAATDANASSPPPCSSQKFPAILEYIPYRKRDGTRKRDEPMHGFFAGHGYVCVRVDIRGSGESDGFLADEYLKQEQDDALEVIDWIARQQWCDGNVGMMGKSWGGFNSLQVAARQPPALKAILVVGFTDHRFQDDIHWKGGCLLNDNFWWGSIMQAYLSMPPDPAIVGRDAWKARWLERLEQMPSFAATWASHQQYDAYWKHGSVSQDYRAIQVPVFAVGGWADAYTNSVFRVLKHLRGPKKAIVGPWAHVYPQDGTPTPAMNFLEEAVRWWNRWLKKDMTASAAEEPALRVYVEDSMPPSTSKPHCPGRWVGLPSWPSPRVGNKSCKLTTDRTLILPAEWVDAAASSADLVSGGSEAAGRNTTTATNNNVVRVCTPLNHGLLSGEWMGAGVLGETPGDQRMDNAMSVTFTSAPLASSVELLGRPYLLVQVTCDRPKGFLFVQLCDVAPDGASTRVSYGLQNLVHTGPDGAEGIQPVPSPSTPLGVRVKLDYCGYTVPAGHRLSISIANSYWPMVWPSPERATVSVHVSSAVVVLPHLQLSDSVRSGAAVIDAPDPVPVTAPPTPMTVVSPGRVDRTITYDIVKDSWTCVTDGIGGVFGEGTYRFDEIDTTVEHNLRRELVLQQSDPLSAHYDIVQRVWMGRPGWRSQVDLTTSQSCDRDYLYFRTHMTALAEEEKVFEKNWFNRVRREAI